MFDVITKTVDNIEPLIVILTSRYAVSRK